MRFRKLISIGVGSLIGLHMTTGGASNQQQIGETGIVQVATDAESIAALPQARDADELTLLHALR